MVYTTPQAFGYGRSTATDLGRTFVRDVSLYGVCGRCFMREEPGLGGSRISHWDPLDSLVDSLTA